ncbi:MAG TPA: hypothetical protein VK503_07650 [Candidatus Bathyarchaeia archaeon]|nr:hypothetical protein [Candidatus Bathyarchaeia archaeon]
MVRKYIVGTRSHHGKIASVVMGEEDQKNPDEHGLWTISGNYVTEDGERVEFKATVTSRGEVSFAKPEPVNVDDKQKRIKK